MRILIAAACIFITIHFIRIDLVEGTIPIPSFNTIEEIPCEDETFSIVVTSIVGDTIESLFALYPDSEMSIIDRLNDFYTLNPHLQRQKIVGGEALRIPLSSKQLNNCVE